MFELLSKPTQDPILSIAVAYQQDTRNHKLDLGVGVYRDDQGHTPIMQAVSVAAQRIVDRQTTQGYLGLSGNLAYNQAMLDLLLTGTDGYSRAIALQTPGASGALRLLAELIASTRPNATIWLSDPSYVNHQPIMQAAGLKVRFYPYFDHLSKQVNEQLMLEKISQLGRDDVVLLHGCCHNPTGADISLSAWQTITELALRNGFLPFVDLAYQGFGSGLDDDIRGLKLLADSVPELLIASSNSKNFGLYRERVGVAIVVGKTLQQAQNAQGKLFQIARQNYTMPPNWGAEIVAQILTDQHLYKQWQDELTVMNKRILSLRAALAKEFQVQSNSSQFDYLLKHQGMFSLTGLTKVQTDSLREQHAIYIVEGGRINIAGLAQAAIPNLVSAFLQVCD